MELDLDAVETLFFFFSTTRREGEDGGFEEVVERGLVGVDVDGGTGDVLIRLLRKVTCSGT